MSRLSIFDIKGFIARCQESLASFPDTARNGAEYQKQTEQLTYFQELLHHAENKLEAEQAKKDQAHNVKNEHAA